MGIRLVAVANNNLDAYLNVHDISINKEIVEPESGISGTYSSNRDRMNGTDWITLMDGNAGNASGNEIWLSNINQPSKDQLPVDSYLMYTFDEPQLLNSVSFAQGGSNANDVMTNGALEYLDSNNQWQILDNITNATLQNFDLASQNIVTSAVRIRNLTHVNIWWRVGEFKVDANDAGAKTPITYSIMRTSRWTVYAGPENNLYDGNDNTYVWYDPDGPGNSTTDDFLVGDFLGYDLGKVATLQSAHIVVGNNGTDKLMRYAIETSMDGEIWEVVTGYGNYAGSAAGKDTLNISLNGKQAQYIRIRNLENRGAWGQFSEFTVTEVPSNGDTEHVYTNIDTEILANLNTEGTAFLTTGSVTMEQNQFIGIKLDNIKQVENIETGTLPNGLKLQTSMNELLWEDYTGDVVDARYIRVINTNDSATTWNTDTFDVSYMFIADKSVTSNFATQDSGTDMRTSGTVNNVFDGNLSTMGMITGPQNENQSVVFDLGQEIDFTSIRYYINETQLNYPRSAIFEVSNSPDGDAWTTVLEINENGEFENVWDGSVAKDAAWLTHDSANPGYMYAEATELDVTGRYLRVRPAKTYSHRWLAFNEIVINDGVYITTESNKDIIAETVEEDYKIPSNAFDKDFETTYQSSSSNSSFTYRISEPEGLSSLRLIQTGEISNATVSVTYLDDTKEIVLGKLNQAINEFVFDTSKTVVSVTVSWDDKIPEISEIMPSTATVAPVDTTLLETEVALGAEENWTKESIKNYELAQAVANDMIANKNTVSQETVNSALGALKAARMNAEVKASNIEELQQILEDQISNKDIIYSTLTYANYAEAILKLENALQDIDNVSQSEADALVSAINSAEEALEYSIRNRELAELGLRKMDFVEEDNYTVQSYQELVDVKAALEELIAQDKAGTRVHPEDMKEAQDDFEEALANLVNISELEVVIAEIDLIDANNYTESSYNAYKEAVEAGKELLEDGTATQISDAIQDIKEAKGNLQLQSSADLEAIIKEAELLNAEDYTVDSYEALATAIENAKETHDSSMDKALANAVLDARKELVSVKLLKEQLVIAEAVDKDIYTKSSYTTLSNLITESETLLISGTEEEVIGMVMRIQNALLALEERTVGLEEYRNNMVLKEPDSYTSESYAIYKDAYDTLMNLEPLETSEAEFLKLKEEFEMAEATLVLKEEATGSIETGDTSKGVILPLLGLSSMVMFGIILIIKRREQEEGK
jgi:hyaluronoglucosaminidase